MHFYYCTLCSVTLVALSGSCFRVRLEWDGRVISWAWLALISVTCPLWFILLPNKPVYGLHFNCYFVIALHVQPSSAPLLDIEGLFSKPAESKKHGKELNFPHQEQERQNSSIELLRPPFKESNSPLSLLHPVRLLLDDFDQEQFIFHQEWEVRRRPSKIFKYREEVLIGKPERDVWERSSD